MIETITIDTEQYAVVPRVPTPEMLAAENNALTTVWMRKTIYSAMIAAAPQPKQAQPTDLAETLIAGGVLWKDSQPEQAQQSDGTVINYGTMVSAEFLECFNHAFSFLANGHSIGQCFDMMKFARAELIKSMKNKPAPLPVPTIILGKGDKLVADIFQEDEDGILRMAGVGIFDPEPGKVYGIGAKNEAIDGKAITEGNPLILIWSDKPESLQVIVEELQESIARMTRPAEVKL